MLKNFSKEILLQQVNAYLAAHPDRRAAALTDQ